MGNSEQSDSIRCLEQVRNAVAKTLGFDDPTSLDLDEDLYLRHFDSLAFAEVNEELKQRFNVSLMSDGELLMPDPLTIRGLAQSVKCVLTETNHRRAEDSLDSVCESTRTGERTIRIRPQVDWDPLALGSDDWVPNSMRIVIAYSEDLSREIAEMLQAGLNAFPHFSGRISGEVDPFQAEVRNDPDGIALRLNKPKPCSAAQLTGYSNAQLHREFFSSDADEPAVGMVRSPLLSVQVTPINDGCVIALIVSHLLVDGSGLALFLNHCRGGGQAADARHFVSGPQMKLVHSRDALNVETTAEWNLPDWYSVEPKKDWRVNEWDLANENNLVMFSVSHEQLHDFRDQMDSGPWYCLSGLMAGAMRDLGSYHEVALWCDLRGKLSIPRGYSGNVGCYWHESIDGMDRDDRNIAGRIQHAMQSKDQIARVYQAIKAAEGAGHQVHWSGTRSDVLPLNLVMHHTAIAIGDSRPLFQRMLTRNVHGLRLSCSSEDRSYLIEACLPGSLPTQLFEWSCQAGLDPKRVGRGAALE